MKEQVSIKREPKVFEIYLILILIATLFVSTAYAQVTDVELDITGTLVANVQDGIFISDITQSASSGLISQEVKYYNQALLSTSVQLSSSSSSYITYRVSLYNNTGSNYYFTGVTYDSAGYDNTKIAYTVDGITPYVTIIHARETVQFNLTFKYASGVTPSSSQKLNSLLRFNFSNDYINFKVNNTSYTAPSGATWQQFVSSEYNTAGFYISGSKVYSSDGKVIILSSTAVAPTAAITSGASYAFETITISLTRTSSSTIYKGSTAKYSMTVTTNGTIKTSSVKAQILNSLNSVVGSASVSGSGKNYTITVYTSSLGAGTYKIRIPAGVITTANGTTSAVTTASQSFTVVVSGGNTVGGNTIS